MDHYYCRPSDGRSNYLSDNYLWLLADIASNYNPAET